MSKNPYDKTWCDECQDFTDSDNPTLYGNSHCVDCGTIKDNEYGYEED